MKFFAVFSAIVAVAVAMPTVLPIQSSWTLQELDAALQDPTTDSALIPFLEHALNQIMDALQAGMQIDEVSINFPVEPIMPVEPVQVAPTPIESAPAAEESAALVQIIINVNGQTYSVPVPVPTPVSEGSPVPVAVVEESFDAGSVSPVQVAEIAPEAVQVVETPQVNPIDVIAVGAPDVVTSPIVASPGIEVGPM